METNEELSRDQIVKLQPFELASYDRYALTSLTAYCVFWLQEWKISTALENVAIASYRMFPVKFSMVGWPDFPDLNRTNRSVLQMRPKYRNLATSVTNKGVFLNENGIREARALIEKIGVPVFKGGARVKVPNEIRAERGERARSVHPEDILEHIRKSQLYELFLDGRLDESEAIHLIELLGVYDHTPSSEKKRKLKEFRDAANDLGDIKTADFLDKIKERFHRYLSR